MSATLGPWRLPRRPGLGPVRPRQPSLLVHEVVIHRKNGQQFTIRVKTQSAKNGCVQPVALNGQKLTQPFLAQQDVAKGGTLVFMMGARPATKSRQAN